MRLSLAISVALAFQCTVAVRLGGGGLPPARRRDEGELPRHWFAAKKPLPPKRSLAPAPTNASAVHLIDAIGRHWLIYERLTNLALRSAGRVVGQLKSILRMIVNYPPRVMVVTMSGIIAHESELSAGMSLQALDHSLLSGDGAIEAARRNGELINLDRFEEVLSRAFRANGCRAVALVINSPGGSPAQSSLLYNRLRELRQRHKKTKLITYVQDSAASGGYYIACAADEIVCDTNSLVGSIGVVSRGFGYVRALKKQARAPPISTQSHPNLAPFPPELAPISARSRPDRALEKQGVERRIHAAGESKAGLDPYLPVSSKVPPRWSHVARRHEPRAPPEQRGSSRRPQEQPASGRPEVEGS